VPNSKFISDLHWVREGQQSRSQKTQEALLDAAEELFSEQGADATSVADVAKRAGCSVGAVYHHFRDKKALLYALFDRMSEYKSATAREALDPERWKDASVADILQAYLEFSLAAARERPAFKRAGLEASRNDPALLEQLAELHKETSAGLTRLLLARKSEIGHPQPKLAIGFVLDQLAAMMKTRLDNILMPTELTAIKDEQFINEAMRSTCGYLQVAMPDHDE
jgi:AcrR family transcriptional regulator